LSSHGASAQAAGDIPARIADIERALNADPAEADRLASELLAVVPGHRIALLLQGIARRLKGDPATAIDILRPLAEESPDAGLVHLQLGLALRETTQNQAAAEALRRAVAVKPDYTSAWLALADLLTAMKDAQGADRAFAMYVKHAMQDPQIVDAVVAVREKRLADATAILNRLLRKFPNDVVALCTLADIAMHERRVPDAEVLLARCLELAPSYQAARHNYAVVLMRQDKLEDALREIDRLVLAEPGNPGLRNLKAAVHGRLGNHEQAIEMYRSLLDQFPNQASMWSNLGHVLRTVGRRDECLDAYRKAIALSPEFGEAWWNLANLKTLQITDADIEAMRIQVDRPGASDENRLHLHFAIGKALEDRKDYEASFRHYAEGNRIRRKSAYYSADETSDYVRRCKDIFTSEFFRQREGCGEDAADPIFIVGLPRVGSTLVEQILSSHSSVEGTRELFNLSGIAMALGPAITGLEEGRYPELLAGLDRNMFRELGRKYLEQTRGRRQLERPFFIDKMPNNFSHTGFIHLTLPRARIIDIRRHPMACGWSLFKQLFARGQHFSYQLDEIGAHYRCYVELMAHFDDVLPGRVHRIHYESLVSDTEREVRRLLEYCGLPFEDACLNFHESRRAVSTPSSEQVRSRIFRDAVEHWRHYEPWLGPLKAALGPFADAYPEAPRT
jgi:tetratricopeptide (TPR) repeat protein